MARDYSYLDNLDASTLKEAILVLEALESSNGSKEREKIAHESKANPVLQEFFLRSLGTEKYYVRLSDDVLSSATTYASVESFKRFMKVLDILSSRRVTGNEAREKTITFLSKCHPRLRKWYMRTLDHDLRIGMGRRSVEKVFGTGFWSGAEEGEFHYHDCCKAKSYFDYYSAERPIEFPVAMEIKLDGERSLNYIFPDVPEVQIYTRGKLRKREIEGVRPLLDQYLEVCAKLNELRGAPSNTPLFLDGEFLATDWNETSSVVSKTENFSESDFLAKTKIVLFDWAPVEDYVNKKFDLPWKQRKQLLMRAAGAQRRYIKVKQATDNIYVLGYQLVRNNDELLTFFNWATDGGFEGAMVKVLDAPHVFHRRHKYVMKLKSEKEATGIITGYVAGDKQNAAAPEQQLTRVRKSMQKAAQTVEDDGFYVHAFVDDPEALAAKLRELVNDERDRRISTHVNGAVSYRHSERLGAFVVDLDGEEVHVGGGFKYKAGQDERMDYWQRRDELIGVPIDIKLQDDSTSVAKARFNRFLRLRWDLVESQNMRQGE
jgi:hypothetical protein